MRLGFGFHPFVTVVSFSPYDFLQILRLILSASFLHYQLAAVSHL